MKKKELLLELNTLKFCVCFLQYQFEHSIFVPEYDKSSVMLSDMCTKPCSGLIISRGTKWMAGFRFYPTSDTEYYQLIILDEIVVNKNNYGICISVLFAL